MQRAGLALSFALSVALPSAAQDADSQLDLIRAAKITCATAPESAACLVAQARSVALVANAVAEAGNTRDRGMFIGLVRPLLGDENPQVRTAALYALAKLLPDAADTPALVAAALDPVSNVRAGAWAAAAQSQDPSARRIVARLPEATTATGYQPDRGAFALGDLGLTLPSGLEPLWIAADARDRGQLHFLSGASPGQLSAEMEPQATAPARPLADLIDADPMRYAGLVSFLDPQVYGEPRVMTLAADADHPERHIVIFEDHAFGRTGFVIVFADQRTLRPTTVVTETTLEPTAPPDDAGLDTVLMRRAGVQPGAPPEETDLYLAVVAADGVGADAYLEVYPDGAYADQMRAALLAPRIEPGQLAFADTEDVTLGFANLPPGAAASVQILTIGPDAETVAERYVADASQEVARFEPSYRLGPGLYRAAAIVELGDGSVPLALFREFSVTLGLATLEVPKTDFAPGEPMVVAFAGMSGDRQDYVATAPAGSPNSSFLAYAYTNAARDGSVTLPAPDAPGTYELRAFFREDESVLRASLPFTVTGGAVATPDPPATPRASTPGQPDPSARATLQLDRSTVGAGEEMEVRFSGMFGHAQDYVATAASGAPLSSYLQYRYTDAATEGSLRITAPTAPGAYEIRAFFMENESILRASLPFTVSADLPAAPGVGLPADTARARLTLDQTTYAPGAPIAVTYADMFGHSQDYVAVSPAGSPNSSYLEYRYTEGQLSGTATLTAPIQPGTYEVRAFFREDEAILRASVTFTVR